MTERQLQFRVGLLVLIALGAGTVLIFQFSDLRKNWQETYPIAIHYEEAPGLFPGTPVRQHGYDIGRVRDVLLDEQEGGVLVVVEIHSNRQLRSDAQPTLLRSILGDASIEFSAGASRDYLTPNTKIAGIPPVDPMVMIQKLEENVGVTLESFASTSREWEQVGHNLNNLMDTHQGNIDDVIERAAVALEQLTVTMTQANVALSGANNLIGDPQVQRDLKATIASLPVMVRDTQQAIAAARITVEKTGENLDNLTRATEPLAANSELMSRKLAGSLVQLEGLLTELNQFAGLLAKEDGTLKKLASDPSLYENLDRSAESLEVLLRNLNPILSDVRVFTDKVARHPELLGVGGALKGSSGIKNAPQAMGPTGDISPPR